MGSTLDLPSTEVDCRFDFWLLKVVSCSTSSPCSPQVELVVEPVHSDPWRAPTIDAVPLDDVDEEDGATCAPGPHITLRPDQYDIVLCVDTAEVTGY